MYLEVGGSPDGPQLGPFRRSFLEAHCQLCAPNFLSPMTLQPWEPNQPGSRDVTPAQLSMSWEEQSQNVFFVLSVFIPSFELSIQWITILWVVCFFRFLLLQLVPLPHRCRYDLLGCFLYRLLHDIDYNPLCCTVNLCGLFMCSSLYLLILHSWFFLPYLSPFPLW